MKMLFLMYALFGNSVLFQDPTPIVPVAPIFDWNMIVAEVAAMAGVAAFIAIFINVGKTIGFIKDGDAMKWSTGLTVLAVIALYATKLILPAFDPAPIDGALGEIAIICQYLLTFVAMLFGSKLTHTLVKNAPLIGKSFSETPATV